MKINLARIKSCVRKSNVLEKGVGLILIAAMLSGCPASNQSAAPASAPPAPNKVVIRGSNTIGEELAPALISDFKKDHAIATFDLETKATGYGLAALRNGQCDIAAASRLPSRDEQQEARDMNVELVGFSVGYYSTAVVVNQNNSVTNLAKEQVRDIFTGKISNWKDVGGPDAAIHLYVRDPISGTYLGFKEIAMNDQPYASERKLFKNYDDIAAAVGQDQNAIGYTGIGFKVNGALSKEITIDGVAPTAAAIQSGKYPFTRELYFYINKGHESDAAKEFVQYVVRGEGQQCLARLGFVPHS